MHNQRKRKNTTSQFRGVHQQQDGKFRASIRVDKNKLSLGVYDSEIEAAKAYNQKAREIHGEFAHLNEIPEAPEAVAA